MDLFAAHLRRLARHNVWANERLIAAVAALPEEAWAQPVDVFFGSLCGTLNHLITADRIWLKRVTGSGEAPTRLDEIPAPLFADYVAQRRAEDLRLIHAVAALTDADLVETLTYRSITAGEVTRPLAQIWAHIFNHHAHHRGQAHTALTRLGAEAPPLDLIYWVDPQA